MVFERCRDRLAVKSVHCKSQTAPIENQSLDQDFNMLLGTTVMLVERLYRRTYLISRVSADMASR